MVLVSYFESKAKKELHQLKSHHIDIKQYIHLKCILLYIEKFITRKK